MKTIVYGAGVLGSLHAARLHEAGHDVSLVARGERLTEVQKHGVLLAEGNSPSVRSIPVPVVQDRSDKQCTPRAAPMPWPSTQTRFAR